MRRQTRPFTVEIKQKRGPQKRSRSIWGDVDLSSAIAETTREVAKLEPPNRQLIDSNVVALDLEHMHKPQAEPLMADPQEAESVESVTEPAARVETPEPKKRAPRPRKAMAERAAPARKKSADASSQADDAAVRPGRKIYSSKERAQKLTQIEKSVGDGATLKSAVKQAGISEQTYYHWKKAAAPAQAPDGDDLKDLVALEEENKRLKRLLAERLRKENAELKKKLGMA